VQQQPQQPPTAQLPQAQAYNPLMGQQGSVNNQGVYTAGQLPQQYYQQQVIPQFQAPQNQAMEAQQAQMIQQLLANPMTMGPQQIAQLQGQSRDQASLLQQQTAGQLAGNQARRGMGDSSRYAQSQQRQLKSDTNRGLLDQFRNIDIQALQQNRADQYGALGAADQFQGNQLQRAIGGYGAQLSGLGAQGNEQQAFLTSLMNRFNNQEDLLGKQANSQQNAIQQALARDQFGAQNSQWGDQMEFNYRQAQQNEQNNLLQNLLAQYGGQ
jgi:hypothetical protein